MSWRDFVQNNKKYWMEYLAGLVYFILLLAMAMGIALLIIFFSGNTPEAKGQDFSTHRETKNVWVAHCVSCHSSHQQLAQKTGIRTEQYLFNYVYEHKDENGRKFGNILPGGEIEFVSRFILVSAYLNKLESDLRKAGEHLQRSINL